MTSTPCHYCKAATAPDDASCPSCAQSLLLQQRYRLLRVIGQGGFGVVYEAQDLRLKRRCAIKRVSAASLEEQEQIAIEANILSQHASQFPFICDIYDFWNEQAQSFLAMEYIDGASLDELLVKSGPWPAAEVEALLRTLLGYLAQLHDAGIIHRDLKPSNIRRTSKGRYVLLDFGIAKSGTLTLSAAKALTLDFSPPEQLQGLPTDARSDLYSLGATAYQLLTGTAPAPVSQRQSGMAPLPLRATLPSLPPGMERLLLSLLELDATRRPASAAAALAQLDAGPTAPLPHVIAGAPSTAQPAQRLAPSSAGQPTIALAQAASRQPLRSPWLLIGGGIAGLALVLLLLIKLGQPASSSSGELTVATAEIEIDLPTFSIPTIDRLGGGAGEIELAELTVLERGFGQDATAIGYGLLVENPASNPALRDISYEVIAYAKSGTVIGSSSSDLIHALFPGEQVYLAGDFYLDREQPVERIEVRFEPGRESGFTPPELLFEVGDVTYKPEEIFPQVSGLISNLSEIELKKVKVDAIAYDAGGKIVGGGSSWADFIPPQGQAAIAFNITASGKVDRVELYPRLSISSDFPFEQ